ncbi:hypothetical protein Q2941_41995 [Bradyrhizobium sp. UFLA05-153]
MADTEFPNCFEPYLRYAIATDFKYFESFDEKGFKLFLLVEFIDVQHAEQFGGEMDNDNHPHAPPGIEFGPSDPASRFTTMRGFKAAVGPSTFQSWIDHVLRVELSLPVKPTTAELVKRADLRDRTASKYPPTEVLIGQIDDGCPFAATRFTKFISSVATGTRVRGIWDQNPDRNPIRPDGTKVFGKFLTDFNYGLEFLRDSDPPGTGIRQIGLDEWIELHTTNTDLVDEDDCYADAHFKTLKRHRSHGGHVMDTLAGRVPVSSRIGRQDPPSWQPDSGPAATADIVFVQFSEACLRDATGVWLKSYVVDGIYYILSFVDPTKTKNIVVNVSYGPTTGPHDGTAELEDALTDLVTIFDGTHGKPKLDVFLAVGNSYLSDGHLFFENKTTLPVHAEWIWRIPPDNSVLCFAEVWMSASAASGVVVTLTSPSGLISTSVTGPIPPPPGIPFPSYTGAYAPRTWGSNTMWLLTIEPAIAGPGFVPEHGDWTIRVDYIGVNANVHAYVARTDPNFDVHSGARSSRFVDPQWEESLSAEESLEYADGEFDLTGSRIKTHGTLNGIATAQEPSVHVAGGYILSNGRKSSYASAGPARGGPREGPDYVLPCDESYALQGILGGGNRSGGVFRLIGTSVAAPQLARHFANADGGVAFPMATDVPTDPSEVEKRGGGDLPPP